MKIYTKTGDEGDTGLFCGPRVSKDDVRIEAYGTVDELCSLIGLARSHHCPAEIDGILRRLQRHLFALGAELATPDPVKHNTAMDATVEIPWMESTIDELQAVLPELKSFILPGGSVPAAHLHHARTVCRRAERRAVELSRQATVSQQVLVYLNRASDLLFVVARYANVLAGVPEIPWVASSES